jgi:hypothetical protein
MKHPIVFASVLCFGLALAGCDNNSKNIFRPPAAPLPPAPAPPPPAAAFEDNFGAGFGEAFRRGEFDEPREIVPGDIIPVSFTDDPLEIPPGG